MATGLVDAVWNGGGASMDSEWGFPKQSFAEKRVAEAGKDDWQWYSTGLFEAREEGVGAGEERVRMAAGIERMEGESESEVRRRRALTVLAVVREHEMKESGINRGCVALASFCLAASMMMV
eukprot:3231570-Rhodomonas_salina.1